MKKHENASKSGVFELFQGLSKPQVVPREPRGRPGPGGRAVPAALLALRATARLLGARSAAGRPPFQAIFIDFSLIFPLIFINFHRFSSFFQRFSSLFLAFWVDVDPRDARAREAAAVGRGRARAAEQRAAREAFTAPKASYLDSRPHIPHTSSHTITIIYIWCMYLYKRRIDLSDVTFMARGLRGAASASPKWRAWPGAWRPGPRRGSSPLPGASPRRRSPPAAPAATTPRRRWRCTCGRATWGCAAATRCRSSSRRPSPGGCAAWRSCSGGP